MPFKMLYITNSNSLLIIHYPYMEPVTSQELQSSYSGAKCSCWLFFSSVMIIISTASLSLAMQPKQLKSCDHIIVAFSFIHSYLPSPVKPEKYKDFGTWNTQAATLPSSKLQNNTSVSYHCDLIKEYARCKIESTKELTQKQNKDLSPAPIKSLQVGASH